jgi:uncharacterized surface protein with fasciclin (FAS1) repeats
VQDGSVVTVPDTAKIDREQLKSLSADKLLSLWFIFVLNGPTKHTDEPWTLFVPLNDGLPGPGVDGFLKDKNKTKQLILNHLILGTALDLDAGSEPSLVTEGGTAVKLTDNKDGKQINGIKVVGERLLVDGGAVVLLEKYLPLPVVAEENAVQTVTKFDTPEVPVIAKMKKVVRPLNARPSPFMVGRRNKKSFRQLNGPEAGTSATRFEKFKANRRKSLNGGAETNLAVSTPIPTTEETDSTTLSTTEEDLSTTEFSVQEDETTPFQIENFTLTEQKTTVETLVSTEGVFSIFSRKTPARISDHSNLEFQDPFFALGNFLKGEDVDEERQAEILKEISTITEESASEMQTRPPATDLELPPGFVRLSSLESESATGAMDGTPSRPAEVQDMYHGTWFFPAGVHGMFDRTPVKDTFLPEVKDIIDGTPSRPAEVDEMINGTPSRPAEVDEMIDGTPSRPAVVDDMIDGTPSRPAEVDEMIDGTLSRPAVVDDMIDGTPSRPAVVDDMIDGTLATEVEDMIDGTPATEVKDMIDGTPATEVKDMIQLPNETSALSNSSNFLSWMQHELYSRGRCGGKEFLNHLRESGVADELDGSQQYTAIIPTDEAFYAFYPIDWGFNPFLVESFLNRTLREHLLEGDVALESLPDGSSVKTLAGNSIRVSHAGGDLKVEGVKVMAESEAASRYGRIYSVPRFFHVDHQTVNLLQKMHPHLERAPLLGSPWPMSQFLSHLYPRTGSYASPQLFGSSSTNFEWDTTDRFHEYLRRSHLSHLVKSFDDELNHLEYTALIPSDVDVMQWISSQPAPAPPPSDPEGFGIPFIDPFLADAELGNRLVGSHILKGRLNVANLKNGTLVSTILNDTLPVAVFADGRIEIGSAELVLPGESLYNLGAVYRVRGPPVLSLLPAPAAPGDQAELSTEDEPGLLPRVVTRTEVSVSRRVNDGLIEAVPVASYVGNFGRFQQLTL